MSFEKLKEEYGHLREISLIYTKEILMSILNSDNKQNPLDTKIRITFGKETLSFIGGYYNSIGVIAGEYGVCSWASDHFKKLDDLLDIQIMELLEKLEEYLGSEDKQEPEQEQKTESTIPTLIK